MMLESDRIDGFILSDLIFNYHKLTKVQTAKDYQSSSFTISENKISWSTSKEDKIGDKVIIELERLVKNGTITRILNKYR